MEGTRLIGADRARIAPGGRESGDLADGPGSRSGALLEEGSN